MHRWLLVAIGFSSFHFVAACTDDDGDEDAALFEQAYDDNQVEPKADGTDCSGVRVPDRPGFGKRIALTFDDGPNPETTPKVIEILHRHNAPAAFFNNGMRYGAAGAKPIAAQIAADPLFILANHSQRHLNLAQQSATTIASEIDGTDALIREAGETPRYFRFPFGSATCSAKQAAVSRGYIVTGWHIDSADWCYAAGGGYCKPATFKYVPDAMRHDMLGYVMSQAREYGGGIILFHDIHASTANNLDAILTALEGEGFSFVRLDDPAVFPRLNGATPPAAKFIGDKCETDADCAFTANGQAGHCHAAKFCTISCAGSCPDLDGKAPTFCIADAGAGTCAVKPALQNGSCAALPLTVAKEMPRFVGSSGVPPSTATVCAPR